jgi:hypothetical protein
MLNGSVVEPTGSVTFTFPRSELATGFPGKE